MSSKKFVTMDVTAVEIRLHPKAQDFLFKHFVALDKIFSNVLGQLETNYISIALINQKSQIFFLSSIPSIEYNLIEKELWQSDGSYHPDFINQDQPKLWDEFHYSEVLRQHKKQAHDLVLGISLPKDYLSYRALFSFGFKKNSPLVQNKVPSQCEKLLAIGKYCLRKIREEIVFPDEQPPNSTRPKLKLIINHEFFNSK